MRWLFKCVRTFTLTEVLSDKSTSASNLMVLLDNEPLTSLKKYPSAVSFAYGLFTFSEP